MQTDVYQWKKVKQFSGCWIWINAILFSIQSFDYKIALDIVDRNRTNIFISTELDKEIQ